jgi:hypothetical protein
MAKYGRLKENILYKSLRDIKHEGFLFFIKKTYRFFEHRVLKIFAKNIVKNILKKPKECFSFQGRALEYLIHPYNLTWINERTVEVPIVLDKIKESKAKSILELGAVLPNYTDVSWDVVDKFEKGKNTINQDIIDFKPTKKYDLIVSISTLEHVGHDDEDNPEKINAAIEKLKTLLNKKGKIIVTMPLGYNKYMDNLIFTDKIGFNKMFFMKRINRKNKWIEVGIDKVREARYNYPYNNANAVFIGVYEA